MLYNIIILEFSIFFYMTDSYVTVMCDITLTSNPKFKIRKINKKKRKVRKKMKINRVYYFQL